MNNFTEKELVIVKSLIKVALKFEEDSYSLFSELALANNDESIEAAINEMVEDVDERTLIYVIHNDPILVEKIKNFIK